MRDELQEIFVPYLLGVKSVEDCLAWLSGIDWNGPGLSAEERGLWGSLELYADEVSRGSGPSQTSGLWFRTLSVRLTGMCSTPNDSRASSAATSSAIACSTANLGQAFLGATHGPS